MKIYNPYENFLTVLNNASNKLGLKKEDITCLMQPNKQIIVNLPIKMDDGKIKILTGYRVQYNNKLGPYKGGIRYHKDTNLNEVIALAGWMTIKCAVSNIPYGGGKGGITVDKSNLSINEIERLTRAYARAISSDIGSDVDIPAPDVNTDSQIMEWIADEYGKVKGVYDPAVVTGKPLNYGGSNGRQEATGRGVTVATECILSHYGKKLADVKVAVQGNGNVGGVTAYLLSKRGATIVAISDSSGTLFAPSGLDYEQLHVLCLQKKRLIDYKGANVKFVAGVSQKELLECQCDVLIPAALENQIDEEVAKNVKAKFIIEGANGPTTSQADAVLAERDIVVVPDILANSGGVVCSYYEWKQNKSNEHWSEEKVNEMLDLNMKKVFDNVYQMSKKYNTTLRVGAYMVAVERLIKE